MVYCTERDSDLVVGDRWGDSRDKETCCFLSAALSFPFLFFTLGVALESAHAFTHISYIFLSFALWVMLPCGAGGDGPQIYF